MSYNNRFFLFALNISILVIALLVVSSSSVEASEIDFQKRAYDVANSISNFYDEIVNDTIELSKQDYSDTDNIKTEFVNLISRTKVNISYNVGSDNNPIPQTSMISLYSEIAFIDKEGIEVLRFSQDYFSDNLRDISILENTDYKSETYFRDTKFLPSGDVYIGSLMTWYDSYERTFQGLSDELVGDYESLIGRDVVKKGVVRFSSPVFDSDGEFNGIIVLSVDYRAFQDILKHIDPTSLDYKLSTSYAENYILAYDFAGDTIYHPKPNNIRGYIPDGTLAKYNVKDDDPEGIFNLYNYSAQSSYLAMAHQTLSQKKMYIHSAVDVSGRNKLTIAVPIIYDDVRTNFASTGVLGGLMFSIEVGDVNYSDDSISETTIDSFDYLSNFVNQEDSKVLRLNIILYSILVIGILVYVLLISLNVEDGAFSRLKIWYKVQLWSGMILLISYFLELFGESAWVVLYADKFAHAAALFFLFAFFMTHLSVSKIKLSKVLTWVLIATNFIIASIIIFTKILILEAVPKSTEYAVMTVSSGTHYIYLAFIFAIYAILSLFFVIKSYIFYKTKELRTFIFVSIFFVILLILNIYFYVVVSSAPWLLLISPLIIVLFETLFLIQLKFVNYKRNVVSFFIFILIIFLIFIFALNAYNFSYRLRAHSNDYLSSIQINQIEETHNLINHRLNMFSYEARTFVYDDPILLDYFEDVFARSSYLIDRIYILDDDLSVLVDSSSEITSQNISRFYTSQELDQLSYGEILITDFYDSDSSKDTVFGIVSPILLDSSDNQGYVIFEVPFKSFSHAVLLDSSFGDSGHVIMLDADMNVLFSPYLLDDKIMRFGSDKYLEYYSGYEKIFVNSLRMSGTDSLSVDSDQYLVYSRPFVKYNLRWGLVSIIAEDDSALGIGDTLRSVTLFTFILILLVIATGFAANLMLTYSLRREIKEKTNVIESKLRKESKTTRAMTYLLKKMNSANNRLIEDDKELKKLYREKAKWSDQLEKQVDARTYDLKKANKHITDILIRKTEFLNQVSHDLRTPLTPIKLLLDLILQKKTLDSDSKSKLKKVKLNVDSLEYLVGDILNLVKLDKGSEEFDFMKFSLNDLLSNYLNSKRSTFKKNKVEIESDFGKIPITAIDKSKMTEVIEHIISNAIKFLPEKNRKIIVRTYRKGGHIFVEIKDNGLGMDKKNLSFIFEDFFKLEQYHGGNTTGLGLGITKRIIDLHGGNIWADSKGLHKGLMITFTIPIRSQIMDNNEGFKK